MYKQSWLLALLAVLVMVVCYVWVTRAAKRREGFRGYLEGIWVASPAFLETADLGDIQLFISPAADGEAAADGAASLPKNARKGYIIMSDKSGALLSNQGITVTMSGGDGSADRATGALDIEYEEDSGPLPERLSATLSVSGGSLVLHDKEKVYAALLKDHAASEVARSAWERDE